MSLIIVTGCERLNKYLECSWAVNRISRFFYHQDLTSLRVKEGLKKDYHFAVNTHWLKHTLQMCSTEEHPGESWGVSVFITIHTQAPITAPFTSLWHADARVTVWRPSRRMPRVKQILLWSPLSDAYLCKWYSNTAADLSLVTCHTVILSPLVPNKLFRKICPHCTSSAWGIAF